MDAYFQALKALALTPPFNKPCELDRIDPVAGLGGPSGGRSEGKKNRARKGTGRGSKSKKNKGKAGAGTEGSAQTFWTQVEDFFRDVADADVALLAPRPPLQQDPHLALPRLGRPYHQVWQAEDDAQHRSATAARQKQSATVAKQKLLSASPVSKARKRPAAEASSAPLVTSVLSPLIDENDEPCDVCYEGDSDELNAIIFCDGCDVAVHQNCYGVATVPRGEDPWFCLRCSAPDPAALACVLCPHKKGAMKPVAGEEASPGAAQPGSSPGAAAQHAHLFCAQWIPETYIREGDGAVMNVGGVLKERTKLTCVLCKVKQGACIQCSHGQCAVAFHPLCARANKLRMEIASREDSEEVELRAFCVKHSKERPAYVLDLNPPAEPHEGLLPMQGTAVDAADGRGKQELEGAPRALPLAHVQHGVLGSTSIGHTPNAVGHTQKALLFSSGSADGVDTPGSRAAQDEASRPLTEPDRPLQLRGGAPNGDDTEDEGESQEMSPLGGPHAADTDADEVEGHSAEEQYTGEQGEAEPGGDAGVAAEALLGGAPLNTFELSVLPPEQRRYLSASEQAQVDTLLACLDSTLLIELAKGVMAQLNITQTALAHMAQVSQSMLSYWLHGRNRPSQEAINVKMRAFLRSYCVATEVPAEADEDGSGAYVEQGQLPYYDVEGYYPQAGFGLQEPVGGNMAGGHVLMNGGPGGGADEGASEGSELLHHLAARTAASTGRALHPHMAPGAPAGGWDGARTGLEEEEDGVRHAGAPGLADHDSKAAMEAGEDPWRGDQTGAEPDGVAGRGGVARKASRSQRKRGGGGSGWGGAGPRPGKEVAGSMPPSESDAMREGPPRQQALVRTGPESSERALQQESAEPSSPLQPTETLPAPSQVVSPVPEAAKVVAPPRAPGGEAVGAVLGSERGPSSRVRGAARASALRAAAAGGAAAGAAAGSSGQKGGAGQKRSAAPRVSGPEEVHEYTIALAGQGWAGGETSGMGETEAPAEGKQGVRQAVGEATPGTAHTPTGLHLGAPPAGDELSVAWQEAQLAAVQPLLGLAPEDEVVGELYAQQAALLAQAASNGARAARLLQRLLPRLPAQLRAARARGERSRLVGVYLAAEKEAKKHDRKLRKDKEAAAVLAAATAAAAASPRNTHLRREGSFGGGPGAPAGGWEAGASPAGPVAGGPMVSPQTELARAAAAGAAAGAAAVSSGRPPKAPGSGPRGGGPAKPRARQKGESAKTGQVGRPAGRSTGAGAGGGGAAGERSWRGKPVRPSLPDEWPQAGGSGGALCAVCGQGESGPPNEVVLCARCGVAVHQECYGVRTIPAAGPWWCQPCAYHRQHFGPSVPAPGAAPGETAGRGHPGTQCALCPGRTGAMKRATAVGPGQTPRWVHVFCAQWMPGIHPGKGEGALVEGLETLGSDRADCRCSLCGSKLGACLTCSAPRCSHKFHASCARNASLAMTLQSTPDGRLLYHQYCEQHSAHPQPVSSKEGPSAATPSKEQELDQLKTIRVEFERVRMICDRVVHREKLKRERVRTLREMGAIQLALAQQAVVAAGEGDLEEHGATPRPQRQKKSKERDGRDGVGGEGPALGELGPISSSRPADDAAGPHIGGPRTNLHQKKRFAAGEGARDAKRARLTKAAQERQTISLDGIPSSRNVQGNLMQGPTEAGGRVVQQWARSEDIQGRDTHAGY